MHNANTIPPKSSRYLFSPNVSLFQDQESRRKGGKLETAHQKVGGKNLYEMESNPPPLPTTMKRPRRKAREVSSRYMSTPSPSLILSSSSSPFHQTIHKHRKSPSVPSSPDATDTESEHSDRFSNENLPFDRHLESPLFMGNHQNKILGTQRKAVVRLFGDNGACSKKPRPATPMASFPTDRVGSTPKGTILSNTHLRGGKNNAGNKVGKSNSDNSFTSGDSEIGSITVCDSPPINGSRLSRQVLEFRSSMPEADLLPSMSSRRVQNDGNESNFTSSSICCRSLNMGLSSSQQNPFQNNKSVGRIIPSRICLPPQPPSAKLEGELKKGKKGLNKQEEIHMLRLCHNKYLQWRFVNQKAREAVDARTIGAEKSLYGLSAKISEMQISVIEKRIELERLRRLRSLSSILDLQMPYLDQWSNFEGEYSSSLEGVTKALQDASIRLPINGNVKADTKDIKDVFNSTMNTFQSLSPCVQRLMPQAEGIEDVISDLAEIVSMERALIEECGNLVSEARKLQVTECSLRSQLMQAKSSSGV